jgi:hypothetical protein
MEPAQHTGMNNQPNDNNRFDRLEALIRSQIGGLRAEIGGLKSEVGGLSGEVGGLKGEVSGLSVRVDGLHAQIKIVAEGHGALVDNITDVKAGIARLEKGQDHLQLRMIAVESRLGLTR